MSDATGASRIRAIVRGRVQGVAFRAATADAARREGVGGWVRNREDGSVEAVLEGEPGRVESLLGFLRRGPPPARVEEVETREEPPQGEQGFRIAG